MERTLIIPNEHSLKVKESLIKTIEDSTEYIEKQASAAKKTQEPAKRRRKRDTEGREFVCSCGKKYLSYPALYTHNKTKHQGELPMSEKPKKAKNCEDVFTEFFSEQSKHKEYFKSLELFKACLNERGFQMEKIPEEGEYCKLRKPGNIPKMGNFFLLKYLKFKNEEADSEEASKAVEIFCLWLYQKKYTEFELERFQR